MRPVKRHVWFGVLAWMIALWAESPVHGEEAQRTALDLPSYAERYRGDLQAQGLDALDATLVTARSQIVTGGLRFDLELHNSGEQALLLTKLVGRVSFFIELPDGREMKSRGHPERGDYHLHGYWFYPVGPRPESFDLDGRAVLLGPTDDLRLESGSTLVVGYRMTERLVPAADGKTARAPMVSGNYRVRVLLHIADEPRAIYLFSPGQQIEAREGPSSGPRSVSERASAQLGLSVEGDEALHALKMKGLDALEATLLADPRQEIEDRGLQFQLELYNSGYHALRLVEFLSRLRFTLDLSDGRRLVRGAPYEEELNGQRQVFFAEGLRPVAFDLNQRALAMGTDDDMKLLPGNTLRLTYRLAEPIAATRGPKAAGEGVESGAIQIAARLRLSDPPIAGEAYLASPEVSIDLTEGPSSEAPRSVALELVSTGTGAQEVVAGGLDALEVVLGVDPVQSSQEGLKFDLELRNSGDQVLRLWGLPRRLKFTLHLPDGSEMNRPYLWSGYHLKYKDFYPWVPRPAALSLDGQWTLMGPTRDLEMAPGSTLRLTYRMSEYRLAAGEGQAPLAPGTYRLATRLYLVEPSASGLAELKSQPLSIEGIR